MDIITPEKMEPLMFKLLLSDPKYSTLLAPLYQKEWLNDSDFGKLCAAIIKLYEKNSALPKFQTMDLIASKLFPDTYSEVSIKIKAANSINISEYDREYLDEELLKYIRNQGIYWTIMSNVEEIEQTHSVEGMIGNLKELTTMNFDFDLGLDYLKDIELHCEELAKPDNRLGTGWDELDYVMNGGLLRDGKCLACFVGETHIGKSLILSNMASNMLRAGKFVVLITLEMSETVYGSRIDAHLTKNDINGLKYNLDSIKDTANQISGRHPDAKLVIKEFPPDTINCNHIKSYIDKLSAFHGREPDAIIVDYVNLLVPACPSGQGDNTYNKYRVVTTELRRLSYLVPKPVVTVSQVNRSGFGNTEADLDSISDSFAIPMICDFVGILFQREGDREAEILNMAIKKNRLGGRIGKILQFHIDYSNLCISDIQTKVQCPNSMTDDVLDELKELEEYNDWAKTLEDE